MPNSEFLMLKNRLKIVFVFIWMNLWIDVVCLIYLTLNAEYISFDEITITVVICINIHVQKDKGIIEIKFH